MMQPNEKGTQKDLVLYRIETSKSDIKAAEILFFYIATREEAEEQIQTAKELVTRVEEYVQVRWETEEKLEL